MLFMNAVLNKNETFIRYSGAATDLKSDQFYYTEEHEECITNGIHNATKITYKDDKGKVIAKKTIDFSKGESSPAFLQEDMRDGYMEGAEIEGEIVKLLYKKNKNEALKTKELSIPEPVVIDGGFNNFVKKNWKQIQEGSSIKFNFAVPSQLDYFTFRVKKEHESICNGKKAVVFKMEADNFLIRQLVAPIILTYDVNTMRLMKYEGLSNINDGKGKSYQVKLTYPTVGP